MVRLDPETEEGDQTIGVGNGPGGIASARARSGGEHARRHGVADRSEDKRRQPPIAVGRWPDGCGGRRAAVSGSRNQFGDTIAGSTRDEPGRESDLRRQPAGGSGRRRGRTYSSRSASQHRPPRRHVDHARGSGIDSIDRPSRTIDHVAVHADDQRRSRCLQPGRRPRGRSSSPTSPSRSDADGRGQDVYVPGATGHPLLERRAREGVGHPLDVRARLRSELPVPYYDGIVGAARCRRIEALRPLARDRRGRRGAGPSPSTSTAPDPEFLHKLALRFRHVLPAGHSRGRRGTQPLPATGPYVIARYRPDGRPRARAEPVLPRVVAGGPARGLPGRDRRADRRHGEQPVGDVIRGKADVL